MNFNAILVLAAAMAIAVNADTTTARPSWLKPLKQVLEGVLSQTLQAEAGKVYQVKQLTMANLNLVGTFYSIFTRSDQLRMLNSALYVSEMSYNATFISQVRRISMYLESQAISFYPPAEKKVLTDLSNEAKKVRVVLDQARATLNKNSEELIQFLQNHGDAKLTYKEVAPLRANSGALSQAGYDLRDDKGLATFESAVRKAINNC